MQLALPFWHVYNMLSAFILYSSQWQCCGIVYVPYSTKMKSLSADACGTLCISLCFKLLANALHKSKICLHLKQHRGFN